MKKVYPGQAIKYSANEHNQIVDMYDWWMKYKNNPSVNNQLRNGEIWVENTLEEDLEQFAIVAIDGDLFPPELISTDLNLACEYAKSDYFSIVEYDPDATQTLVILQQPIPQDGFAKARLSGISKAKVDITDTSHMYATPTDGDRTVLTSAESGAFKIVTKGSDSTGECFCKVYFPYASGGSSGGGCKVGVLLCNIGGKISYVSGVWNKGDSVKSLRTLTDETQVYRYGWINTTVTDTTTEVRVDYYEAISGEPDYETIALTDLLTDDLLGTRQVRYQTIDLTSSGYGTNASAVKIGTCVI